MAKVLVKVNIPARVRNCFGFADSFDVPFTKEGMDFVDWWKQAEIDDRVAVLTRAHENGIPITEALKGHLETADQ